MKKKLIASLITAAMLLSLSACGGKPESSPDAPLSDAVSDDIGTDSETITDAPDDAAPVNAAPANGIQLYDGSYLDLDGEYASGVPCKRMGGSEIAASDTTVSFIWNVGMDSSEENYQEDTITESYQWDVNVTSTTPFVDIPAGAETCWNRNRLISADIQYPNDKTEEYKSEGAELMKTGTTSGIEFPFKLSGSLITANETSEPADIYHFSPIVLQVSGSNGMWEDYDDDTSGKPGAYTCIGGKALHSFDDIIAAYGEPMGVYGAKESNITYIWKATGDADVYVLVTYNAQSNSPSINIRYIRDCEASKSWIAENYNPNANGSTPDNLYDILTELGLYEG